MGLGEGFWKYVYIDAASETIDVDGDVIVQSVKILKRDSGGAITLTPKNTDGTANSGAAITFSARQEVDFGVMMIAMPYGFRVAMTGSGVCMVCYS